jgi:hypothetical protein
MVDEIWVNVTEGAQATGYHRVYLKKLVTDMSKKPEEEREIRLRRRSSYWEIWLPDLAAYIDSNPMRGPKKRHKPKLSENTSET